MTNDALKEIYFELDRLQKELIPDEELEMVRNYMLGSILKASDGPFSMAEQFKAVHLKGRKLDYFDKYFQVINEVSSEELKAMANKYLDPNSFLEVVVGKK